MPKTPSEWQVSVDRIADAIGPIQGRSDGGEWLRTIYSSRSERFVAESSTVWTTGGIMIPVSLAGFAVILQPELSSGWLLILLAAASFSLMLTWVVIAENYRSFQNKHLATLAAIERVIGYVDPVSPKVSEPLLLIFGWMHTRQAIRKVRFALLTLT